LKQKDGISIVKGFLVPVVKPLINNRRISMSSETAGSSTSKVKTNPKKIDWRSVGINVAVHVGTGLLIGAAQSIGMRALASMTTQSGLSGIGNVVPIKKVL
jgi:hypothetical protein